MSVVMDRYDALEERQESSLKNFTFLFGSSQFAGALCVVFMSVLMGWNGFGWTGSDKQFCYHPLFMAIGMVFLYGEAILVYRVFRHERKKFTKLLHGVLHGMVMVFVAVSLTAVFQSHNYQEPPKNNLYSLHSWLGMLLCIGFFAQYVIAFLVFFFPGGSSDLRARVMGWHRAAGTFMFLAAGSISIMGLGEYSRDVEEYDKFVAEGIVLNLTGLFLYSYVLLVLYLVNKEEFKRRPLPEETSLQPLTAD